MIRIQHFLTAGMLTAGLLLPAGLLAGADNAAAKGEAKSPSAKRRRSRRQHDKRPRSPSGNSRPELAAFGTASARCWRCTQKLPFNTQQNSATEIMSVCLAFGCGSEVSLEGPDGTAHQRHHLPVLELSVRRIRDARDRPEATSPRGSATATRSIPASFWPRWPCRASRRTIRSASARRSARWPIWSRPRSSACRTGGDLSLRLIGLSYYVDEPEWKNDLGETWSIERMIEEEIAQPVVDGARGRTEPPDGPQLRGRPASQARRADRRASSQRAEKYTADYQAFALQMQNCRRQLGAVFPGRPGARAKTRLRNCAPPAACWSGWRCRLPDKRLEDARVVSAVDYVTQLLGSQRYQWNAPSLSTREIVAMGHALHALSIYDERVFKPADVEEKPAAEKPSPTTASRAAETPKSG